MLFKIKKHTQNKKTLKTCFYRKIIHIKYVLNNYGWLVHWQLMGGLLHLVQREGAWGDAAPPRPLLAVPNVTAHPSTVSVPTSYYSMWHSEFLLCMPQSVNTTWTPALLGLTLAARYGQNTATRVFSATVCFYCAARSTLVLSGNA